MFKKVLGYFSKGELILWDFSVTLIIVSFCIFGGNGFLTLAASLIGVIDIAECEGQFYRTASYDNFQPYVWDYIL